MKPYWLPLFLLLGCDTKKAPTPQPPKKDPPATKPVSAPATKPTTIATSAPVSVPASTPIDPLIRESVQVEINSVKETWSLRWEAPPSPYCNIPEDAMTCPCAGFGYGESGSLALLRERPGAPKEKLLLDPAFAGGFDPSQSSYLPKKPFSDHDMGVSLEELNAELAKRETVKILEMRDYNRDGLAAEFLLQVGAGPCGHQQGLIVGVDAKGGPLKIFGSAANPTTPLVLEYASWGDALTKSSFEFVAFGCGDHGSEEETVLRLEIKDGAFSAQEEVFDCSGKDGMRGKSISKKDI